MNPERWRRIQDLFHKALAVPADERETFLDHACEGDQSLSEHVLNLLAADEEPDPLFGASPDELAQAARLEEESMEGRTVGPYTLVRELGQGGMGTVYLARRTDGQFEKDVALKLVKPGMDTGEILRRFRYERQILAALEHPNVARLYDGGMDEAGRPYLVMEYIEGRPIDEYCDAHRLTVDQRLSLFETVCGAVQFAHQNLVVHRDLKPSNILVTDDGSVKLLDFGIAKLLSDQPDDLTAPKTRTGLRVMTPAYAAPEQIRAEIVTTATDVYALGAVLYELLTGRRPHEGAGPSRADMENAVLEAEPDRPSSVVARPAAPESSQDGAEEANPADLSSKRAYSVDQLKKRLRGDLDTIILMALRKEPGRRYASAAAFAEDIRLHLAGLPVLAQPDTVRYRMGKFMRRHRFGVSIAATFATLLVGFAGLLAVQQAETARERDRAAEERDKAEEVSTFLQSLFDASDPFLAENQRLDTMRVRQFLDRGAERIEREMQDQPAVLAQMLLVIGDVYRSLGLYDKALPLLERSLQTRRELHGEGHPDVAESHESVGRTYLAAGDYAAAEDHFGEALEIRSRHDNPLKHAGAIVGLASARRSQGRYDSAEQLLKEALKLQRKQLGDEHLDVATSMQELGRVFQDRGNLAEAESLYRHVLEQHRRLLGNENPQVAGTIDNLAIVLRQETKLGEAEPLAREALELRRAVLGPEHPQTLSSLYELASLARERGEYEEAIDLFREVIALDSKVLRARHHYVGLDLRELGITYARMDRFEEALEAYEQSLDILRGALPENHMDISVAIVGIGHVYMQMGELQRAESVLREGLAMRLATLGEASWHTGVSKSVLGECLMRQGRLDEAEPLLVGGYETLRDGKGPTDTALRRLVTSTKPKGIP